MDPFDIQIRFSCTTTPLVHHRLVFVKPKFASVWREEPFTCVTPLPAPLRFFYWQKAVNEAFFEVQTTRESEGPNICTQATLLPKVTHFPAIAFVLSEIT